MVRAHRRLRSSLAPADQDYDITDYPVSNREMIPIWSQVFKSIISSDTSDKNCIAWLDAALVFNSPEALPVVDDKGDTVLHVAVVAFRPRVARRILDVLSMLDNVRNRQALTPLEHLHEYLEVKWSRCEVKRSRGDEVPKTVVISDRFQRSSFPSEAVECLCLLTG